MAYSKELAARVRTELAHLSNVEEKRMFRGITFMVNGKMCVSVGGEELMCRIDPKLDNEVLKRNGTRPVVMKGRIYKGYIYVNDVAVKTKEELDFWVQLALDYNDAAKASKR